MSWVENLNTPFAIKTGDGKTFKPKWLSPAMSRDFNTAEFNFVNVPGTFVDRKQPLGRKFPLEFCFDGPDHLEDAAEFDTSSLDNRAWNITHPYYGLLVVQPTSINYDNTSYNVTRITCTVLETITDEFPKGTDAPVDVIAVQIQGADELSAQSYAQNIVPGIKDKNAMRAANTNNYKSGIKQVDFSFAEQYFNAFNTANSAIDSATANPLAAMRTTQAIIQAPAKFAATVQTRHNLLTEQFESLRTATFNAPIGAISKSIKFLYQTYGGTNITAMCLTAATPGASDYTNSNQALSVIDLLLRNYRRYLADLDNLQTLTGGTPTSFIPDAEAMQALATLLNYTLSNLYNIALNGKQERSFLLENDSNWIVLTHRLYGLQPDDSTLTTLIEQNNAGLNEMLLVRKGRKIIYYV